MASSSVLETDSVIAQLHIIAIIKVHGTILCWFNDIGDTGSDLELLFIGGCSDCEPAVNADYSGASYSKVIDEPMA